MFCVKSQRTTITCRRIIFPSNISFKQIAVSTPDFAGWRRDGTDESVAGFAVEMCHDDKQ